MALTVLIYKLKGDFMTKIYSAVKLPEVATRHLDEAGLEYEMFNELADPSEEEIISKLEELNAEILVSGVNVQVTENILRSAPNLKLVANVGAGTNNIDVNTAAELGIPVTNTPGDFSLISTAELAIGLMIGVSRNFQKNREMIDNRNFPGWQVMGYLGGNQVAFKNLFIWGFGGIGQEIAKFAKAMYMDVTYYDINEIDLRIQRETGARPVELDEGLANADYVILMMNLTPDNVHLVNKDVLAKMKDSAYLINTARGPVVDEEAVADAIEAGELRGAAFDVHENEPVMNERLIEMPEVLLTPHVGNDTIEARNEMAETAIDQAVKFAAGKDLDFIVNNVK